MNENNLFRSYSQIITAIASFKNGFTDFIEALEIDKVKKELFIEKAGMHFVNVDISVIGDFLASSQKDSGKQSLQ